MPTANEALHHYVPEWYQKRFMQPGDSKMWYLDLETDRALGAKEKKSDKNKIYYRPIKYCFSMPGLYSLKSFSFSSNFLEEHFFGKIDVQGKRAIEILTNDDFFKADIQKTINNLIRYLTTQYFRTPRGIGIIMALLGDDLMRLSPSGVQNKVLGIMQRLAGFWGTTWLEGVWEIFSAEQSETKLLLSDCPVLTYNPACFPRSNSCLFPNDPFIGWIGTQTLFCLSKEKLLVLTNRDNLKQGTENSWTKTRKNFNPYRQTVFNIMDIIRERRLDHLRVKQINNLLKQRSYNYIASSRRDWLFPEDEVRIKWKDYLDILLPPKDKVILKYKTIIKYTDGRTFGMDQDGKQFDARREYEEMQEILKRALEKRKQ